MPVSSAGAIHGFWFDSFVSVFKDLFILLHVYECFACGYVYHMCVCLVAMEVRRESVRFPGRGVVDGCEPPTWWLGTEPGPSAGAVSDLNYEDTGISPVSQQPPPHTQVFCLLACLFLDKVCH